MLLSFGIGCTSAAQAQSSGNPCPALAALSTNQQVHKLEQELAQKLKKAKPELQADLYYGVAKAAFEAGDYTRAEYYMRESLAIDTRLNRSENEAKTHIAIAIVLVMKGASDAALEEYKAALAIAERNKLDEYVEMITDSTGTLALRSGKYDEAERYYKKAYELGVKSGSLTTQINSLVNQATVMRKRNQIDQAKILLAQAMPLAKKTGNGREAGNTLLNLARVQHDLGEFKPSVETYKQAIPIFKSNLENTLAANACWSLAETLYELQQITQAKEYYLAAKDLLKNAPSTPDLLGPILVGLGAAEADLGDFAAAEKNHKEAMALAKAQNNKGAELQCVLQLGSDYLLKGAPEPALEELLSGEKLLDAKIGVAGHSDLLTAIGRCYKVLGHSDMAMKYYNEALKLCDKKDMRPRRALVLNSMAVLSLDSKNKADFVRYYNEAKEIYSALNDKRNAAVLDYNLAQFYLTSGKIKEALALYEQALQYLKLTDDANLQGQVLGGLGLAELFNNHPQAALMYYEQALKIAEQTGALEAQWDANLGLGKSYKYLGLNDLAISHLNKAVDLVEKERGQLTRDSFKTYNLDLRNDCFSELIDLYARLNKPYEALAIAEKGRARAFLDMLSNRKLGTKIEISQSSPSNGSSESLIKMASAELGTRAVEVLQKKGQIDVSTAISPINASAPDIEEIKSLIKKNKTYVVEYYLLPDKVMVWVIDPNANIRMLQQLPLSRQQVNEKVALAYEAITHARKNNEDLNAMNQRRQQQLRELYDSFIKPLEAQLPTSEEEVVTFVPHGPLFSIPFAALLSGEGSFFVEKHTLAYIPAIGVLRATQKLEAESAAIKDKLLAFGNPITKAIAFLGALPYAEKEVEEIAQIFGKENALVKIGQAANKRNFTDLAWQFSDIHLATHGLIDEENPMQSSLILAPTANDDGLLSVRDIMQLKELKARLVVLSACQTGRGKITGDGVVGLSRAFIIAGTPSVLVSQWNVDDIITEFQMKNFYQAYLARAGKCKSLRKAQLATIKYLEGKAYGDRTKPRANPKYWAAFQLIGQAI